MLRIVTASSYSQSQYLHTYSILYVQRKYKMNSGTTNHIFISKRPHTRLLLNIIFILLLLLYLIIILLFLLYLITILLLILYIVIILLVINVLTEQEFYSSTGFAESITASLPSLETAAPCV